MSTIAEILDRLSGVSVLKERLSETSRNVDKSLNRLLDHEMRPIHLEAAAKGAHAVPQASQPRLPGRLRLPVDMVT